MAARKAASVLPEPVGAAIRVWRPAWISGQARACGSVGEPKRFVEPGGDGGVEAGEWHRRFSLAKDGRKIPLG